MRTMNESWESIEQPPGVAEPGRTPRRRCGLWGRIAWVAAAGMVIAGAGLVIARTVFGWETSATPENPEEFLVLLGALWAAGSEDGSGCCFRRKNGAGDATSGPDAAGGTE